LGGRCCLPFVITKCGDTMIGLSFVVIRK
jgi:hypothetical protein